MNIESKKKNILNESESILKSNEISNFFIKIKTKKIKGGEEEGKNNKNEDLLYINRMISEIETKNSIIEGESDIFLHNTENKGNERLDLSYVYQQFHHSIYVLGIKIRIIFIQN